MYVPIGYSAPRSQSRSPQAPLSVNPVVGAEGGTSDVLVTLALSALLAGSVALMMYVYKQPEPRPMFAKKH